MIRRRQEREEQRLQLMLVQQDHQLLLLKELEQRENQLLHRQREMRESQQHRLNPQPPLLLAPKVSKRELKELLAQPQRLTQIFPPTGPDQ